jgi:RNA-directed DNA polymerase
MKPISTTTMQARAARFCACREPAHLALILRSTPTLLASWAEHPQYRSFYVPKKNGGKRLIEDPLPGLKKPLRRLNEYLQAVYHFRRSPAAYGFLISPIEEYQPRNILSNARQHLGAGWLLNMDMEDFFHSIPQERIRDLFEGEIFGFPRDLADLLAALCCYQGRLPMGAPTSPVLSNFCALGLDERLLAYAANRQWTYTRYADDMSFSSQSEIKWEVVQNLASLVREYGFVVNPEKTKLFTPDGPPKEVTGLTLFHNDITLSTEYLGQLQAAIEHLNLVFDAKFSTSTGQAVTTPWLVELQQQVQGKLAFVKHIIGENDQQYLELDRAFQLAIMPPEEFSPLSWLDFGYDRVKF